MTLAAVDCETTGLDPDRHEIWEVALILHDPPDGDVEHPPDREYVWQLPVDLGNADLIALNIGRFHERRLRTASDTPLHPAKYVVRDVGMHAWASEFARLTWGAHLLGAVPSFDDQRLARLLRKHGACPGWHYHLVDVETLAIGWQLGRWFQAKLDAPTTGMDVEEGPFRIEYPWNSKVLSKAVGVDPGAYEAHTALGDARWALDIYRRLTGEV